MLVHRMKMTITEVMAYNDTSVSQINKRDNSKQEKKAG